MGFAIFKEVGAALAFCFFLDPMMIEGGLVAVEDMQAQGVVGGILALAPCILTS